jgi:hypothetical protein
MISTEFKLFHYKRRNVTLDEKIQDDFIGTEF